MFEDTTPHATVFDPLDLELASSACCGRFGDPVAEVHRLVTLRDLIAGSTALAHELESFARAAASHVRGVHCTANMQPEAATLSRAVVAWIDRMQAAANAHRDWQDLRSMMDLGPTQRAPAPLSSLPEIGAVQPPVALTPPVPAA
jgi:hypothetical protein